MRRTGYKINMSVVVVIVVRVAGIFGMALQYLPLRLPRAEDFPPLVGVKSLMSEKWLAGGENCTLARFPCAVVAFRVPAVVGGSHRSIRKRIYAATKWRVVR